MTECSKKAVEREIKFYSSSEDMNRNRFTLLVVESEGYSLPLTSVKTVVIDRNKLVPLGDEMTYVGPNNLKSARFQLVRRVRSIPTKPYEMEEEVYLFESFIE